MENNCMANPCEGSTEEACVEMMKKLQADEKVSGFRGRKGQQR